MKLKVEGLTFSYENRNVLYSIGFSVKEGEFVSLLGPSGSGKSTILKLLTGVLPADQGRILVDDKPIRGLSQHFAYMPQNDLLFPWKTILDNVCLYGRIHGSLKTARREAKASFPEFGLAGYEDCYPSQLSGGIIFLPIIRTHFLACEDVAGGSQLSGRENIIFQGKKGYSCMHASMGVMRPHCQPLMSHLLMTLVC